MGFLVFEEWLEMKYNFFLGIWDTKRGSNLLDAYCQIVLESNPIYSLFHQKQICHQNNGTSEDHPKAQRGRERNARANSGPGQCWYP